MDHCWRCSPELLQSRHPIWKFNNDDRNISRILKVWRIYKILCNCISYWRFDDLKCFHPRHLQDCLSDCVYLAFSYKIEQAVTKGFSHRFSFISWMAFSQSIHMKMLQILHRKYCSITKMFESTLRYAMITMLIYTRIVHAMGSVLVNT